MFYQRTYLDKCATIVRGSECNTGLNPVSELVWGRNLSRFLVHFDHSKLKKLVEDKTYADITKLKHILKITNAGSLDMSETHKVYQSQIDGESKKRTSSLTTCSSLHRPLSVLLPSLLLARLLQLCVSSPSLVK